MRNVLSILLLSISLIATASAECKSCATEVANNKSGKTIVEVASGAGTFNTLLAVAEAAGLVDTLNGKGPFTVFAPTDEAFAKLPEGTVESLLNDKEKLSQILLYHVVPGKMKAAEVVTKSSLKSVQGSPIALTVKNGKVKVNNANVSATDIEASNGVIHVIDAVIMPPADAANR